jgi:hypothetical protein
MERYSPLPKKSHVREGNFCRNLRNAQNLDIFPRTVQELVVDARQLDSVAL